jgi:predicted alternative tryptophan synthase beta-subunit
MYTDKIDVQKGNALYTSKNLVNWKSGIYMVQLEYEGKTYTRKMLVAGSFKDLK